MASAGSFFSALAPHLDALDGVLGLAAGQSGVELLEEGGSSGHDAARKEGCGSKKKKKQGRERTRVLSLSHSSFFVFAPRQRGEGRIQEKKLRRRFSSTTAPSSSTCSLTRTRPCLLSLRDSDGAASTVNRQRAKATRNQGSFSTKDRSFLMAERAAAAAPPPPPLVLPRRVDPLRDGSIFDRGGGGAGVTM